MAALSIKMAPKASRAHYAGTESADRPGQRAERSVGRAERWIRAVNRPGAAGRSAAADPVPDGCAGG